MENTSTHFIFDGSKIVISPDLSLIVDFLQEIEKEIDSFLGFDKKLESIRKQYQETAELTRVLAKKLKDNLNDFKFTLSEHPDTIVDKFKINQPVRSKFIILFAYLETLRCLSIAYENKIFNEKEIRKLAMKNKKIKSFLQGYCLNEKNDWVKKNKKRSDRITADNLQKLRNALTHFFSVSKDVSIADSILDNKSRKLEKVTNFKVNFLSPEDLYEIIKGSAKLIIIKWSKDCQQCSRMDSNEFKEKILSVNKLIKNTGSIVVKKEQINIV